MTETEPTFCGDLDVQTGDCDLMFLAEEPVDKEMRESKRAMKRGHIQIRGPLSPAHCDDTA